MWDQPGRSQHRHFPDQGQRGLLAQQREGTALACPRHFDQVHAVLGTLHPGYRCRDVAVVLEKVEMVPALLGEVVRRTQRATLRTRIAGTALALHLEVQFMRLRRGIEMLIHQLPWWLDANPQQQNPFAAHAIDPVRNPVRSMAQHVAGFHSE